MSSPTDIVYGFSSFPTPFFWPRTQSGFLYPVYLSRLLRLLQADSLSVFVTTLTLLNRTGQVFVERHSIRAHPCFLRVRLGFYIPGGTPQQGRVLLRDQTEEVPAAKMSYHQW